MPRLAKSLKKDLEALERNERIRKYQEEYPKNLMEALERASKLGWDISVENGQFCVYIEDDDLSISGIPYSIPFVSWNKEFEELVMCLDAEKQKREEAERIRSIRRDALSKLSEEERKALGF